MSLRARVARLFERRGALIAATVLSQFLLVCLILFFSGVNATHGLVTLLLSPERMVEIYGGADAGSYLGAALNLIANGRITPEFEWIYNLWPPGMVWLDALLVRFSPLPFGVSLALVTAGAWAVALSLLVYPFVARRRALLVVALVELLILATSPFQSWMYDEGLLYADGFAAAFLVIALAVTVARSAAGGPVRLHVRDGLLAGIALAGTVYFRASNNLVPIVFLAVGAVLLAVVLVRRVRKHPAGGLLPQALLVATAAAAAFVLLAPYSALVYQKHDRIQFVQTENLVYDHAWHRADDPDRPQWISDAGASLGCELDEETCERFEEERDAGETPAPEELRDALIGAILAHPGEWVVHRVGVVLRQWFGDEVSSYAHIETDYESGPVGYSGSFNLNPPAGLAYLGLLVASFTIGIRLAARGRWTMLVVPLTALALLAPFAIVHVEVRYLIPLKMIGLLAPMLVLVLRQTPIRRRRRVEVPPESEEVV
ncbi:MAG: hypothetical protein QM598_10390 [Protaetiibacter sp.]